MTSDLINHLTNETEKVVLIGTGFIGTYLQKGFQKLCQGEPVYAVKKSQRNLSALQDAYPDYRISVNDLSSVLRKVRPTIIVYAALPETAVSVVREELLPYYEELRNRHETLPDLYSFTPTPSPLEYHTILGNDVHICKILPNIFNEVNGYDITGYGINTVTTVFPWPEDRFSLLKTLLSPYGTTVHLNEQQSLIFLSGKITSHVLCEALMCIRDAAVSSGLPKITTNILGKALRFYQAELFPELPVIAPEAADKSELETISPALSAFMKDLTAAWYSGLHAFTEEMPHGKTSEEAGEIDRLSFALNIFGIAVSTDEQLKKDTENAATKGGVLERGVEVFNESIKDLISQEVQRIVSNEITLAVENKNSDSSMYDKETAAFMTHLSSLTKTLSFEAYQRSSHLF